LIEILSCLNVQVPFLFGVTAIENFACHIIHLIFGRTGKHLFLTDNDDGKPPLLQRMVDNWGDLQFMYAYLQQLLSHTWVANAYSLPIYCCRSALQAFKRRVAYSNVGHDRILTSLLKLACSNKRCLKFFFP
jgi:hypothetical protein